MSKLNIVLTNKGVRISVDRTCAEIDNPNRQFVKKFRLGFTICIATSIILAYAIVYYVGYLLLNTQ